MTEPITIAEARAQCRADTSDDGVLAVFVAAARAKAEGVLGGPIISRQITQTAPALDTAGIRLTQGPVVSVDSIVYDSTSATGLALAADQYLLLPDRRIVPAYGVTWPTARSAPNAVRVTYTAGHGSTPDDVPDDIRMWVLMTVAYLFGQREALDANGRVAEIPSRFVDGLLDPHRVYGC